MIDQEDHLQGSRNVDDLKRLVLSSLQSNGVINELRATIKKHVIGSINESEIPLSNHTRNPRVAALLASDRGQLLTEVVMEFLQFYDLRDSLAMLQMEAGLERLRPSEAQLAEQCGLGRVPNLNSSILEQCFQRHPEELHYPPHHELPKTQFDIPTVEEDASSPLPPIRLPVNDSPVFKSNEPITTDDFSPPLATTKDMITHLDLTPPEISSERDVGTLRNIYDAMERVSLTSLKNPYDDEPFDSDQDETPRPRRNHQRRTDDDAVLFDSRDGDFVSAGVVVPASYCPLDRGDMVEKASL
jgi:hypothetical protein